MGFLLKLFTGNPLSMLWIAGGIAIASFTAGGTAAWVVQGWRLTAVKAEYAGFVAKVKALGEAQEVITKAKDAENQKSKERADEQNRKAKRDLAGLYDAYGKLLDTNSRFSQLPEAPPSSASPADITFDRASLDRGLAAADGTLQGGAEKILRRGDEAIADLDTAKGWAQQPATR